MSTLREVAKRANVSVNTVSRILNGKNKETWPSAASRAERVRKIASELGYRPNSAARTMRTRRLNHVGVLISGAYRAPYEYPIIVGINERMQAAGFSLSVVSAAELSSDDPEQALVLRERFLAGLFVMHVPRALSEYAEASFPCRVWLDSNTREPFGCVYRDDYYAGRLATEKAIASGCDDVLFLGNRLEADGHVSASDRLRGYEDAVHAAGLTPRSMLFGYGPDEYARRVPELLEQIRPGTGIVTTGYLHAEWCAHATARQGLCAGRDYPIACCTSELQCDSTWPWLSRVSFNRQELGRQAADIMLALLDGKKAPPSFVQRGIWIEGDSLTPSACVFAQAGARR